MGTACFHLFFNEEMGICHGCDLGQMGNADDLPPTGNDA